MGTRHWHPVARVHLFFGFKMCVSQKNGVTPIGCQTLAMHLCVPKKRVHQKKLGVTPIGYQTSAPSGARAPVFLVLKCVYPKKNSVTPIGCQTLAPSGAHAPVCPQEKGASKKTGWDTHWVPDIGTQWRACTCFFGFKMCVSQKKQCDTHWVPDIGTQWRACTCVSPRKGCIKKNWVGHPLGTRHWFQNVSFPKKLV